LVKQSLPTTTKSPLVLFAELELAVSEGDFEAAAEVVRKLARFGIRVKYGRPSHAPDLAGADR